MPVKSNIGRGWSRNFNGKAISGLGSHGGVDELIFGRHGHNRLVDIWLGEIYAYTGLSGWDLGLSHAIAAKHGWRENGQIATTGIPGQAALQAGNFLV